MRPVIPVIRTVRPVRVSPMLPVSMHLLTDRGLENLVALTRLLGTLRFFHRTAVPVVLRRSLPLHAPLLDPSLPAKIATLEPAPPRLRGKLAFLANAANLSFAEHDRLREIVGSPTAGTNGDVAWLHLPAGYAIRWTAVRVRKHDGSRHHGVGIHPTVPVSPTLEGVRAGRDEVLERAIEVVSR